MHMVCPNCGMENEETASVCAGCGDELKKSYGKDFAWAALILGIWSMFFYPYLFAPLTVIAAALAKRHQYRGKMSIVGMALGLTALVGWAVFRVIA